MTGPLRRGVLALAGVVALVSLALPWSSYVSPGMYIPTTELVTVVDYDGYQTTEVRPGLPTFVPGSLYISEGFDTSIRVLAPLVAGALVWGIRHRRRAVVRGALLVGVIAPGLSGDWSNAGSLTWLAAVALAAVGTGVLHLPARPAAPAPSA